MYAFHHAFKANDHVLKGRPVQAHIAHDTTPGNLGGMRKARVAAGADTDDGSQNGRTLGRHTTRDHLQANSGMSPWPTLLIIADDESSHNSSKRPTPKYETGVKSSGSCPSPGTAVLTTKTCHLCT
jgi:hypothetical protein